MPFFMITSRLRLDLNHEEWVRDVVSNSTIDNISVISWRSVLLVEDTGVPGENHRPVASN